MAARARRAVAHLARLALRAGGAPDAAAWAADTDDLPFGVHDADSVEAGAARAGPGGARQRHRDSVNSAVCTDYAPGLRRGAPRDEPGDRRASLLVEGCGVRQPQDESRAAACDDRVPLNRLTQLPRRCDCPIRPRVLEEAKRPALLARGP